MLPRGTEHALRLFVVPARCSLPPGSCSRTDGRAQTAAAGRAAGEGARGGARRRLGRRRDARPAGRQRGRRRHRALAAAARRRRDAGRSTQPFLARHPDWPGLETLRRAGRAADAGGPRRRRGHGLLRRRAAADRHRARCGSADALAASGQGRRGRGGDRARLARDLDGRGRAEARPRADWSGTIKPHHVARLDNALWHGLDRRGRGDAAAGRSRTGRRSPGRRIAARRDADGLQRADPGGAGGAARRPGPRLRALPLPRREGPLGRGRGVSARRTRPRPRRSGGRRCGWSAAPTSRARRCAGARWTTAYRLAARSFGDEGADYADAEWLAGLHRADPDGRPGAGGRAFPALPRGGR